MAGADFIPVKLSVEGETKLKRHLKNRVLALKEGLNRLHEDKINKWRAAYEAKPREETRDFPFYNASNLVVPIIAIFSDTLLARTMSAVLKTKPMWAAKIIGAYPEITDNHRSALEEAMEYAGLEPELLDLYRVYHEFFGDTIKYGTSMIKCPHEVRYKYEVEVVSGDGTGKSDVEFMKTTDYEGPRPEKLPFEHFMIPPNAKTLKNADIKIHKRPMTRPELEERKFFKIYDPFKVDTLLTRPDRTSPENTQSEKEQSAGAQTVSSYGYAEWDLYECWLEWPTADGKARPPIIATYHLASDTLVRVIYDTHSLSPWILGRLFYRDDMIYGYGFCETMWSFQEEVSEQHNARNDNRTISNTRLWRVDPDSKLHAGYRIYPSAMVPAAKDEIEALACGDISAQTIDDERFSIELAERRAGISPPMQGAGAGSQGKRGIYSAMGTLSVMQEGNRRTDLNISDLRYSHTALGRVLLADYAKYGISEQIKRALGSKEHLLSEAVDAVKAKKITLPIYSSTSSVNKEVEKQNDLILANVIRQHYIGVSQLLTQINSPMIPPVVKSYLTEVIKASNRVMKSVLRSFDKEDVDLLVPEPEGLDASTQQAQPNPGEGVQIPGVVPFRGGGGLQEILSRMPHGGDGKAG